MARITAAISVLLWLASLTRMAYTGYGGIGQGADGVMTLLFGWGVHPAWYANLLFFAGVIAVLVNSPSSAWWAAGLSGGAVLLSLSAYMVDDVARQFTAFGLGLGTVLWLAAIQVLLLASCIQIRNAALVSVGPWSRNLPIAAAFATLLTFSGGTVLLAAYQRHAANGEDLKQLQALTFLKLNPLCTSEVRAERLDWRNGVVEIVESVHSPSVHDYVLNLKNLHGAGVGVTRYKGQDLMMTDSTGFAFRMDPASGQRELLVSVNSTPSRSRPQPSVLVPFSARDGLRTTIHAGEREVRSFFWAHEAGGIYCPRLQPGGGSSVEQYVKATLARSMERAALLPREIPVKAITFDDDSATPPYTRKNVGVDQSCRGRFEELSPKEAAPFKDIAGRYHLWGPFRLAGAPSYYFLNLDKATTSKVYVVCDKSRILLVGLENAGRHIHLVDFSLKELVVQDWMRAQAKESGWNVDDVKLRGGTLHLHLIHGGKGTKAELTFSL